jgi:hypothetical protein
MSVEAASLSLTVRAMRPMVPALDFDVSKRFYIELGFRPRPLTDRLVEMQLGVFSLHPAGVLCARVGRQFRGARDGLGGELKGVRPDTKLRMGPRFAASPRSRLTIC